MHLKKFGVAILALFCVSLTVVAAASAADALFLFGSQTASISEGKGTLSTATQFFSITCEKTNPTTSTVSVTNDTETFSKGKVEFEGCSATGLGLPSGHIAFEFKGLLCLVSATEATLEPCAYIEVEHAVHVEVPIIGLVEFLAGSSEACTLSPDGTSTKTISMACKKASNGVLLLKEVKDLGAVLKPGIKVVENHSGSTTGAIESTFKLTVPNAGTLDG